MRFFACTSSFLIILSLSGCQLLGQQGATVDLQNSTTVNLHTGTVGDLRVGERLDDPAAMLKGCEKVDHGEMIVFTCNTGPYTGMRVTTWEVDGGTSISDIQIGSDFRGTVEEGVGIGASGEAVRDQFGQGDSCWGSPIYFLNGHTISFSYDGEGRVRDIMIMNGRMEC